MKFLAFFILVLCAVMAAQAGPNRKKQQPKCDLSCSADYTPVCAGIPNDKSVKPRLFGNECVLDKHNCESKSNLVKISMDSCKGSGGVRLS